MPGIASLNKAEYYGHPQNSFWKIIYALIDIDISDVTNVSYAEKISLIKNCNIALWDVLSECIRKGSLDSNIKKPQPNDITTFLSKHNDIKAIFFNGMASQKYFKRYYKDIYTDDRYDFYLMPSTSPARAIPFSDKLDKWQMIKNYL